MSATVPFDRSVDLTDPMRCVAVAPDGRWTLSGGHDHKLRVHVVGTWQQTALLAGHTDTVICCAISRDGRWALSGSWDNTLRLWDLGQTSCARTFTGHSNWVVGCGFSPDGRWVLSASCDKTLAIWDPATGARRMTLEGHSNEVNCCAISPDGQRILSGSWDNTLKLWESATGRCLLTLTGHSNSVEGCAFSPDGRRVLSTSWDKSVRLWDAATGQLLTTLNGHAEAVVTAAFSPDSRRCITGSFDNTLRLWDCTSGQCLALYNGHAEPVMGVAYTPDGRFFVSASKDKTLKMWRDPAFGSAIALPLGMAPPPPHPPTTPVAAVPPCFPGTPSGGAFMQPASAPPPPCFPTASSFSQGSATGAAPPPPCYPGASSIPAAYPSGPVPPGYPGSSTIISSAAAVSIPSAYGGGIIAGGGDIIQAGGGGAPPVSSMPGPIPPPTTPQPPLNVLVQPGSARPPTAQSSVQDVCTWLMSIGLSELVSAFTANAINGTALLELTEADMPGIGVTRYGHKKTLAAAIRRLKDPSAPQDSPTIPRPTPAPAPAPTSVPSPAPVPAPAPTTGGGGGGGGGVQRFATAGGEAVVYKGMLGLPPNFRPAGTCKEVVAAMATMLQAKVPLLMQILDECETACASVSSSPSARKLIDTHHLTRDEVSAIVLYTYDIGTMGQPSENFYFQLNEILRRRNVNEMRALMGYLYYSLGALRKLPAFKGTVFRGNNAPDIIAREYTTGRKIFWSAFTSTTVDLEVAKAFAGSSGVVFRVAINSGRVISAFSVIGGENEVLLPPNAGLIVAKEMHREADGIQYVDLVEEAGTFRW